LALLLEIDYGSPALPRSPSQWRDVVLSSTRNDTTEIVLEKTCLFLAQGDVAQPFLVKLLVLLLDISKMFFVNCKKII
jgi:hypothetical protein